MGAEVILLERWIWQS